MRDADELYETRDYLITVEPQFFEGRLNAESKEKQLNPNDADLLNSKILLKFLDQQFFVKI